MPTSEKPLPDLRKNKQDGGKSVTRLTSAQLSRKRASDREAQKTRRKKTQEQIESLEKALQEASGANTHLLAANNQLESRLSQLEFVKSTGRHPESKEQILPQTIDTADHNRHGITESNWQLHNHSFPIRPGDTNYGHVVPPPLGPTPQTTLQEGYLPAYLQSSEAVSTTHSNISSLPSGFNVEHLNPIGQGPGLVSSLWTQSSSRSPTSVLPEDARSRPTTLHSPNLASSCWQKQPSVYAWQLPTKLSPPDNFTDEMILTVLQSQRHSAMMSSSHGEVLIGPKDPNLAVLFGWEDPLVMHPIVDTITKGLIQVEQLVSTIPDKVAAFLATYRFSQWLVDPSQSTYENLEEWHAPRPTQLLISHPAWMDHPPWGKFRDKIIQNQHIYGNLEFQIAYFSGLKLHWPYNPMDALCMVNGQLQASPLLKKQLKGLENMTMTASFVNRYPEFKEICKIQEI